jgi:predicted HTH domain antitoxin
MSTISLDVPEETLESLNTDSESFAHELPLLAAVKLFELGKLSSGRAAQLAGMGRVEFLMALPRYQVAPFRITEEELREDLRHA